ncbi:MAG: porphobilinogen synthase [Deltaproteobacteria bacterium]|nr:porphobilinogen synthase [Deltaproteobacteria bacterium]
MMFPEYRARRVRKSEGMRRLVRETSLCVDNLVLPLFTVPGKGVKKPIDSMPGCFHLSADYLVKACREAYDLGIPAVILFGVPDKKDPLATGAYAKDGVVQKAVAEVKAKVPELVVITDVCLCAYMDHGHCGVVEKGVVDNDASLDLLARTAVSHAEAGADVVAPSDMMDGRVAEIREALDDEGLSNTAVLSYAVKYCSAFYGPFRDAAHSAPGFGDRSTYQMDPANSREALREAALDIEEGADILMVKPALPYLDIVRLLADETDLPLAAYNVSGEFSMIHAAARMGWLDLERAMMETLVSIRRAGADMILTYFAVQAAKVLGR